MKSITFTNNMSSELMQWMTKYSESQKLTRRAVLEQALSEFRKSTRRKEYTKSFKKARLDSGMKSMAESGLEDYFRQFAYLEQ